jgi:phospholipid/cholesterol/gamma-HCH transport system substrate-binding protein
MILRKIKNVFHNINLRDFNNLFVGAFLASSLCIFFVITLLTLEKKDFFAETYHLYCNFDKGLGLNRGTIVQVNGVEVGQVDSIGLAMNGTVRLRLKIKSVAQKHITSGSEVYATRDKNVISDRIIFITHGDSGMVLKDKDEIKTASSQDIEALLEHVNQLLGRIDRIVVVADTLLKMAVNPQSTVGALLGSKEMYNNINAKLEQVGVIAEDASGFLKGVYGKSIPLIDRLDSVSRTADLMLKNGNTSVTKINQFLTTANATLTDAQELIHHGKTIIQGSEEKLERADELMKGIGSMWLIRNTLPQKDSLKLIDQGKW